MELELHSCLENNLYVSSHNSDVSDRDSALETITKFFGQQNVVPVSNFTQLQMRSLIKDVCKLEGISFEEANQHTKDIEREAREEARKTPGFDAALWVLTYEEAEEKSPTFRKLMETHPGFKNTIKVLFKEFRGVSRHAGGVIITEDAFVNMPVIKSGGVLQTPWSEGLNFRHLEYFGMLKFDILGLGTLRMFEECIRKILKKEGHKYVTFSMVKDWYYKHLHPDNNNMDDIRVYKHVYWEGNFAGIFQFVQPPAQKFIAKMQPRSVLDIATATSIFRPGPLSLNVDKSYLKNRKNPKGIKYRHPLLEEVLGDTAGLLVFQEQLQQIYHKLAGVPLEDTDKIRKAFTKKDLSNKEASDKVRNALRDEFVSKCKLSNDVPEKDSGAIFDEMEALIAYSFNCCLQFDTKVPTYNKQGEFLETKNIQDICAGTYVKSRDETTQDDIFVEVKENHNNGVQEVFEFMFENGKTVCCTMNHKFRTTSGEMLEISEILNKNLEIVFDDEKKTMHTMPDDKQVF